MGEADGSAAGTKKRNRRKRAEALHPVQPVPGLLGVLHDRDSGDYEAVVELPKRAEDGSPVMATSGKYPTADEAARAYDALARMYQGEDAPTNFAVDAYSAFEPPTVEERRRRFEVRRGEPLTAQEVEEALVAERAVDVRVLDLAGAVSGFRWLVVCGGRSTAHMRRLADMVFKALLDRRLRPSEELGEWGVEGRDSEDWMVVDCGDVVVNVFSEEGRAAFGLDERYAAAAKAAAGGRGSPAGSGADAEGGAAVSGEEGSSEEDDEDDGGMPLEEAFRRFGPRAFDQVHVDADAEPSSDDEMAPAGDVEGLFDPARSAAPSDSQQAMQQGASTVSAEHDDATRWVAANPIPKSWMDKTERENAARHDFDDSDDDEGSHGGSWAPSGSVLGRRRV